jgi:hypothetical protein
MFVEIAAIQKLTLLLGQPVYSLTVTLASLLVFSGLGSVLWGSHFSARDRRVLVVPALLALYLALWAFGSPLIVEQLIAFPLPLRIAGACALLAPLGLLLGIPFAHGLRVLDERAPALTPWAWAVNGCFGVVGSVLTVVLSMNFGFAAVLWIAALVYALAFAALDSTRPAGDGK